MSGGASAIPATTSISCSPARSCRAATAPTSSPIRPSPRELRAERERRGGREVVALVDVPRAAELAVELEPAISVEIEPVLHAHARAEVVALVLEIARIR